MASSKASQLFTGKNNVNFVLYLNIIFPDVDTFFIRSDIIRIWKYFHSDMELFGFLLGSPLVLNGIDRGSGRFLLFWGSCYSIFSFMCIVL